jgi:hypothetical protein
VELQIDGPVRWNPRKSDAALVHPSTHVAGLQLGGMSIPAMLGIQHDEATDWRKSENCFPFAPRNDNVRARRDPAHSLAFLAPSSRHQRRHHAAAGRVRLEDPRTLVSCDLNSGHRLTIASDDPDPAHRLESDFRDLRRLLVFIRILERDLGAEIALDDARRPRQPGTAEHRRHPLLVGEGDHARAVTRKLFDRKQLVCLFRELRTPLLQSRPARLAHEQHADLARRRAVGAHDADGLSRSLKRPEGNGACDDEGFHRVLHQRWVEQCPCLDGKPRNSANARHHAVTEAATEPRPSVLGSRLHSHYNVPMRARITIGVDVRLRQQLMRRAEAARTSLSEVVRGILENAMGTKSIGERAGHLIGRLRLPRRPADEWEKRLRERNWRP